MTTTTPRPQVGRVPLSPAQQAILALLVRHNKRYAYVADLVGIEFDDLRERAYEAVSQLVGWEPRDEFDELLIDNALGQLPAEESGAVAVHLRHNARDRSLDARIAAALDRATAGTSGPTHRVTPGPKGPVPAATGPVITAPVAVTPAGLAGPAPVHRESTRPAILRSPAPLRLESRRASEPRRATLSPVSSRSLSLLSLGLSSIAAGGVLLLSAVH